MGIDQTAADRDAMLNDAGIETAISATSYAVACHAPNAPQMNTYPYYKGQGVRMRIDAVTDALEGFLADMEEGGDKTG